MSKTRFAKLRSLAFGALLTDQVVGFRVKSTVPSAQLRGRKTETLLKRSAVGAGDVRQSSWN